MTPNTIKLQAATPEDADAMTELVFSSGPATFEQQFIATVMSKTSSHQLKEMLVNIKVI
ncbi:MAG: hypothetical protein HRU24_17665 [Gammaproteobacteria bacterium]|nr:hypothetical protein [Gammaproteobacteria bacterium]